MLFTWIETSNEYFGFNWWVSLFILYCVRALVWWTPGFALSWMDLWHSREGGQNWTFYSPWVRDQALGQEEDASHCNLPPLPMWLSASSIPRPSQIMLSCHPTGTQSLSGLVMPQHLVIVIFVPEPYFSASPTAFLLLSLASSSNSEQGTGVAFMANFPLLAYSQTFQFFWPGVFSLCCKLYLLFGEGSVWIRGAPPIEYSLFPFIELKYSLLF